MTFSNNFIPTTGRKTTEIFDGQCSSSLAADAALALFDEAIRFYKLRKLQDWMCDHNTDCGSLEEKIEELKLQRTALKDAMKQANSVSLDLKIQGSLSFELVEKE